MKLLLAVLALVVAFALANPTLPDVYVMKGEIRIPTAEVIEPFTVWNDKPNNRQKVVYYNGMDEMIHRNDLGYTESYYAYMASETKCDRTNGNVAFEFFLFDNKSFQYFQNAGTKVVRGMTADVYEYSAHQWGSVYTIYSIFMVNNKPVRFSILGGTSDTTFEILEFTTGSIPESAFAPSMPQISCKSQSASEFASKHVLNIANPNVDTAMIEAGLFLDYAKNHNKTYDVSEHESRRTAFINNLLFVESHNRAGKGYTLAINKFSDMTDAEFKKIMLPKIDLSTAEELEELELNTFFRNSAPNRVDWREKGKVTPVRDQAMCGSCWSFAASAVLESQMLIKHNKNIHLSPQSLMDCSWEYSNSACNGGIPGNAMLFAKQKGIGDNEKYGHYLMNEGHCHLSASNKEDITVAGVYRISNNADAIKQTLASYGPLTVLINATPRTFNKYHEGVYDDATCVGDPSHLDHAVTLVGYDTDAATGKEYWIIKNSWSPLWGDKGYVKIAIKDNRCGVTDQVAIGVLA
eukprot:TRINITY_DN2133_c0_g2_i2.p1 TRINITY_DN2133_c0_g2~~TRINITY_DN2133_c0_g2_i2.p1  ORF type:complete len:521 (-),score=134.17 TRINITY_DN2133_c0_g2_i2:209-1771(-)